jgi:hypothetical protein
METAYLRASEIFQPLEFPSSLEDKDTRAALANDINSIMGNYIKNNGSTYPSGQLHCFTNDIKRAILKDTAEKCKSYILNEDDNFLTSIALRLWSGCVAAAKNIASGTKGGPNDANSRSCQFLFIDHRCKLDPVYRAGVEIGPIWKRLIGQGDDIFFDGVALDSPVLKYKDL